MARDDDNFFEDDFSDDFDEFDDDELDEDDTPRPVPHPDDRLWRHPSELASLGAPSASASASPNPVASSGLGRNVPWHRARPLVATAATVAIIALGITQLNNANNAILEEASVLPGAVSIEGSFTATQLNASLERPDRSESHNVGWQSHLQSEIAPAAPTVLVLSAKGVTKQHGLVLDRGGHIVTPARGLAGAEEIRVLDDSGRESTASIIGTDAISDLAVLRTDTTFTPSPRPLSSSTPRVGDPVLIMTNKRSNESTVAQVRATHQRLDSSETASFFHAIHIEVPGPGSLPGTPAFSDNGTVIGIVSRPVPDNAGEPTEIVAMIPSRTITAVSNAIIDTGTSIWPWLGIELDNVDDPNAGTVGPHTVVTVASVSPGSPAELAGLRIGDRITAISGQPVTSPEMIGDTVQSASVGDSLVVAIDRSGAPLEITAILVGRADATVEVTPVATPG